MGGQGMAAARQTLAAYQRGRYQNIKR